MGDDPASPAFTTARGHAHELGLSLLDAAEMVGAEEEASAPGSNEVRVAGENLPSWR